MGKLEDRVNEILGVESKPNAELMQQKEYNTMLLEKKIKKNKMWIMTILRIVENITTITIEKGQEAIQGILDVAKEGQHLEAYGAEISRYQKCSGHR